MRTTTKNMKAELRIKRSPSKALTAKQKRELAALAALPDSQIDTSDIPELPRSAWKDAVRGRFYRPVKQVVSMRLDTDVVAWLKKSGKGYQARANRILRQQMLSDSQQARHLIALRSREFDFPIESDIGS
ncbi:MAG: BrnA antitoxin family protein [Candidatus Sulfotelmatobacter sp.]